MDTRLTERQKYERWRVEKGAEKEPERTAAHEQLVIFLGTWTAQGTTSAGAEMHAEHVYEWLDGAFFMIHKWRGEIAGQPNHGVEVLGVDKETGTYFARFFDNNGWARDYSGVFNERVLSLAGAHERVTYELSRDGETMSCHWQHAPDGRTWTELCCVTFKKTRDD